MNGKRRVADSEPPAVRRKSGSGDGMDIFRESRHNRDVSPFDRAILGGALRSMMDELSMRTPRGTGEAALPRYVRRGRPPIVTSEIAARILDLQGAGLGYKRIARAVGIGATTVRRVLRKAKERR